jgi:beta-carotene ketolase (CrtW type)
MGILIALLIFVAWGGHLLYSLLSVEIAILNPWMYIHILLQTWLFTGLFITGHDAMHGTVSRFKWLNNSIGFIVTLMYAGMWYPTLIKQHRKHHLYPATADDPDFCVKSQNFFVWWFSFMKAYLTIGQLIFMAVLFNIGLLFFNEVQLLLLWVLPAIASTFQLFYFGTYQPHRQPHTESMLPHKARSQSKNHLRAFLSCYFFGYHYEHHESPGKPWWKLFLMING